MASAGTPRFRTQVLTRVLGVDAFAVALVLTGALHAHYRDRTDIATLRALQRAALGVQAFEFGVGLLQRVPPVRSGVRRHPHRQLNHLLLLQVGAADVHQEVADPVMRRRRELKHETRIEPVDRAHEVSGLLRLSVRLVRLVEHHNGPKHLEDVEQAVLHRTIGGGPLQVGIALQQAPVGKHVVAVGKERGIASRVPEHPQEFLPLHPIGRGKHQQHDAEIVGHIRGGERNILFQHLDAPAARPLQHLPVGVLPAPQRVLGLLIDRPARHDPQGEARGPVQPLQRRRREQGLAPAGGHFETGMRDGSLRLVSAGDVVVVGHVA